MKKPSNPKRKPAQATAKSRAPSQAKPARRSRARKHEPAAPRAAKRSRPRPPSALPARVPLVAEAYSADERQVLLLLLTPFVVMTIAVGMSQALMQRDAPVWQVAHSLSPTTFVRWVSPSELVTASASPVEALTPSGALQAASTVAPPPPLRASPAPAVLEASPTLARLETSPPTATLKASPSPAPLEASLPVEVVTRAVSRALLGRCKAPWRTPGRRLLMAVATADPADFGHKLARAARAQTRDIVIYTDKYRTIRFPMGDVPPMYGVCTDLVIRAYRMLGVDLQVLVHKARLGTGDPSIDHRRTKTLRRFFARHGDSISVTEFPEDYQPGDIVTYRQPLGRGSQLHIAIVSDVIAASGRPMIVHNRGWGPQLEDALFYNQITGHYRYAGPAHAQKASAPRTLPLGSHPARKPVTVLSAR
ncbi:MAG: DUF1287 domain-containing protein [Hyphomicrobium sp.]